MNDDNLLNFNYQIGSIYFIYKAFGTSLVQPVRIELTTH